VSLSGDRGQERSLLVAKSSASRGVHDQATLVVLEAKSLLRVKGLPHPQASSPMLHCNTAASVKTCMGFTHERWPASGGGNKIARHGTQELSNGHLPLHPELKTRHRATSCAVRV